MEIKRRFKGVLHRLVPNIVSQKKNTYYKKRKFHQWVSFWEKIDFKYNNQSYGKEALEYNIISTAHVVEKGIAMPNRRYGFGYEKVRQLINQLNRYHTEFGTLDVFACQSAINSLCVYRNLHIEANFVLPNDILDSIDLLCNSVINELDNAKEFVVTKDEYFSKCNTFAELARRRHTVRCYSKEEVSVNDIIDAIALAQTAPSACNRQSTKVKIIRTREKIDKILSIQNGNRGFGFLANKILIITADLYAWEKEYRSSAFLDAGIFLMNLLYSLHEKEICACTLNAHLTGENLCEVWKEFCPQNEIPVAFVLLGKPLSQFSIARSERCNTKEIVTVL